jgi:hypothetical protein
MRVTHWRVPFAGLSLRKFEDLLVTGALALMVLLPLAESFLRRSFHTGISGSTLFVQHLVLYVGMLGGAIAARERRLLSRGFLEGGSHSFQQFFCRCDDLRTVLRQRSIRSGQV